MRYGVQGSGSTQTRDVSGGDTRQTTISGLSPSTTYSIQVAAVNSVGIGEYSPSVIVQTAGEQSVWYHSCTHEGVLQFSMHLTHEFYILSVWES